MKHAFFDIGNGSYLGFMCPTMSDKDETSDNVPIEMPNDWATDINSGLGVNGVFYHYPFWADDLEELKQRQKEFRERGAVVMEVIDHGPFMDSIYFRDPNGLLSVPIVRRHDSSAFQCSVWC